ncbi:MAG: gas vesicle protein [Actinomycetota bacterium]|nr:gas vesicle protein [Actinomycetota bacterium]
MAEKQGSSQSGGPKKSSGGASGSGSKSSGISGREAVQEAKEQIEEMMGKPVEAVLGMERDDDDGWMITVQVVELRRVPNSTDVLGSYAVSVDSDGNVDSYRRTRRFYRSQADEG